MASRVRSGQRSLIGAALAVLVATLATAIVRGSGSSTPQALRPADASLGYSVIGNAPVPVFGDVAIPADQNVLFFGGDPTPGDKGSNAGAVFKPASGEWTSMAPAPFRARVGGSDAVWTGAELVVLGIDCAQLTEGPEGDQHCSPGTLDAAAYSPAGNQWRSLDVPIKAADEFVEGSDPTFGYAVGWDGREAVFKIGAAFYAFAPASATWRELPNPGKARLCPTRTGLVAATIDEGDVAPRAPTPPEGTPDQGLTVRNERGITVAALPSAGAAWSDAGRLDAALDYPNTLQLVCGSDALLAYTTQMDHVWTYDYQSGQWAEQTPPPRELATAPPPLSMPFFTDQAWTGKGFAFWSPPLPGNDDVEKAEDRAAPYPGYALSLDAASKQWAQAATGPSTAPFHHQLAWVDGVAYLITTSQGGERQLATFRPV